MPVDFYILEPIIQLAAKKFFKQNTTSNFLHPNIIALLNAIIPTMESLPQKNFAQAVHNKNRE
jgi:hypothetical protein